MFGQRPPLPVSKPGTQRTFYTGGKKQVQEEHDCGDQSRALFVPTLGEGEVSHSDEELRLVKEPMEVIPASPDQGHGEMSPTLRFSVVEPCGQDACVEHQGDLELHTHKNKEKSSDALNLFGGGYLEGIPFNTVAEIDARIEKNPLHGGPDVRAGQISEMLKYLLQTACKDIDFTSDDKVIFLNGGWVAGREYYMHALLPHSACRVCAISEVWGPTSFPCLPQELQVLQEQAFRRVSGCPGMGRRTNLVFELAEIVTSSGLWIGKDETNDRWCFLQVHEDYLKRGPFMSGTRFTAFQVCQIGSIHGYMQLLGFQGLDLDPRSSEGGLQLSKGRRPSTSSLQGLGDGMKGCGRYPLWMFRSLLLNSMKSRPWPRL